MPPEQTVVDFGPITVSFSSDEFSMNVLGSMYGDLPESNSNIDIKINAAGVSESNITLEKQIKANDNIYVDGDRHVIDQLRHFSPPVQTIINRMGDFGYYITISGWERDILEIEVLYDKRVFHQSKNLLHNVFKLYTSEFSSYGDLLSKVFVYDILEPILHAQMISNDTSLLHAASISIDGQGVILTGQGGTGKTSTTINLLNETPNSTFLSDDLAIVTKDGDVHPYNKSCVVYAYNTGDTISQSQLVNGLIDQMHWKFHYWNGGKKGVRRRVSAEKLFNKKVQNSESYPIETVVYLSREKREDIAHEQIEATEVAQRSTAVILNELDWLVEYSSAVCSTGSTSLTPKKIIEQTEKIYTNSFADSNNILLHIPFDTGPQAIVTYLQSNVIESEYDTH